MFQKSIAISGAVVALLANYAQAADTAPSRRHVHHVSPVAPVISVVPVVPAAPAVKAFTWEGVYGGIQGSKDWGRVKTFDIIPSLDGEGQSIKNVISVPGGGFSGGLFLGYNKEIAKDVILGIDTDLNLTNNNYSFDPIADGSYMREHPEMKDKLISDDTIKVRQKWNGATRLRLGMAHGKVMPYVAAGVAYSGFSVNDVITIDDHGGTTVLPEQKRNTVGYTLGAGADFALANNAFARIEYRYTNADIKNYLDPIIRLHNNSLTNSSNSIRVGLGAKF